MSSAIATSAPTRAFQRFSATKAVSYLFTGLALGALVLMVAVFAWQSLPAWKHEGVRYLTGQRWFYRDALFGAAPMIYGTAIVALIALALAGPLGIGAGMFVAEYLPPRLRFAIKVAIELLAGIPSVVYGLLGILFLRDWIYQALTPF